MLAFPFSGLRARLLLLWALLPAACAPADPELGVYVGDEVTHNDFEAAWGWLPDTASLTTARAHSGHWAIVVDSRHEVGLTYDAALREASVHTLRALDVQAWVFLPGPGASAELDLQVWPAGGGGAPTHWDQLRLLDQVTEFNQWVPVHCVFKLPAGLGTEDRLRLFLRRGGSTAPVYLDDLLVKARE